MDEGVEVKMSLYDKKERRFTALILGEYELEVDWRTRGEGTGEEPISGGGEGTVFERKGCDSTVVGVGEEEVEEARE
jgi:hypothetical protein